MLRDRGRAAAIREHETRSLAEVHRTVPLPPAGSWLRRMFAFQDPRFDVQLARKLEMPFDGLAIGFRQGA